MSLLRNKVCEVLVSTALISLITPSLIWGFMIFEGWLGGTPLGPLGKLVIVFIYGSLLGLITMGIYIVPGAFLVSLLMASLKGWSPRAVGAILLAVVIISSVASLILDPMRSREQLSFNYLRVFDPIATKFNLMGIVSAFAAALVAFWARQFQAKRRNRLTSPRSWANNQMGNPE